MEDTQKSKNASDVFNALDGLGFTTRNGSTSTITELGKKFIEASRESEAWEQIAREGAQNYGPFAGLVYLASRFPDIQKWVRGQINLGFCETGEEVSFNGETVTLSTGSQSDTITRSRSSIINWGVASGYFIPNRYIEKLTGDPAQVQFNDYLMAASLTDGFWNTQRVYEANSAVVKRPLSYNQLVKATRSLRENGQEAQRHASLEWETVIKNRRLAIAYALNRSASLGKPLIFAEFVSELSNLPDFVINKSELSGTLAAELGNAFVIGTPYEVLSGNLLQGVRTVDLAVLSSGADPKITDQLENLLSKTNLFEA